MLPFVFLAVGLVLLVLDAVGLTITGFRDWKHATGSKGALSCHNNSISHKSCVVAWDQSKSTSVSGTVSEQLGNKRSEIIKNNRHYITAVSDVLLVARWKLPCVDIMKQQNL